MGGRAEMTDDAAWALLAAIPELRIAGILDGRPVVRTMHHAVHDGRIWLHAPPRSTVGALAGGPVQLVAEQIVARIPSWMRDPLRACPATTFYRSVLVDGRIEAVTDPVVRAAALQRMMTQRQPEGRHVPIEAEHPLYAAPVRGLGVWAVRPTALHGVQKLGTQLTAAEIGRIVAGLWARGEPGDLAAIEAIAETHPARPLPVAVPDGLQLHLAPTAADAEAAVALLRGRYWNVGQADDQLLAAALASTAWVGLSRGGRLIATARAIADRAKRSWVYDVVVDDAHQRTGLGSTLMGILLDHPAVRATEVNLSTRDAETFYARMGFEPVITDRRGPYPRTWMRRLRPTPSG